MSPQQTELLFDIPFTALTYVEGGTFVMGDGSDNNNPPHTLNISSLWVSQYPVVQTLYEAVMGHNPSHFKHPHHPVERMSWFDAILFCNKLSLQTQQTPCYYCNAGFTTIFQGLVDTQNLPDIYISYLAKGYRLPSEAEWEYVAKGGKNQTTYLYAGSNDPDMVAWHEDTTSAQTQAVGLKQPNTLGLYDLSGNVWEWCNDWYDPDYYTKSISDNPQGPDTGDRRMLRGGSWIECPEDCRVDYRCRENPIAQEYYTGLRVYRSA